MRFRSFLDTTTAVVLSVVVHIVLAGIFLVSLQWTPAPLMKPRQTEPVKAVVMDEERVVAELEKLKQQDAERRKREDERVDRLESEADTAREKRLEE